MSKNHQNLCYVHVPSHQDILRLHMYVPSWLRLDIKTYVSVIAGTILPYRGVWTLKAFALQCACMVVELGCLVWQGADRPGPGYT